MLCADRKFIFLPLSDPGNKNLPDSGRAETAHQCVAAIPMVKVANERDGLRIWSPDGKLRSLHSMPFAWMGTQHIVELIMAPFVEEEMVHLAKSGQEVVGVVS